jgi:16S rRNA processing protein RimM
VKEISELELIQVGKFVKTFGYKGELLLKTEAELDEIPETELFFVVIDKITVPFFVDTEKTRFNGNDKLILKLNFVNSEKEAVEFVGRTVLAEKKDIVVSDDNADFELSGYEVFDFDRSIGIVENIVEIPGNPLISIINSKKKEVLIPFNEQFIVKIDSENRKLFLQLPEGLCDIND